MNFKIFSLILSVFLMIQIESLAQQPTIHIEIWAPDSPQSEVIIRSPIGGRYFAAHQTRLPLNDAFTAQIDLTLDGTGIVEVSHNFQSVKLLAQAGDSYRLIFTGQQAPEIQGNHAEGQKLYNLLLEDNTRSRFEELDVFDHVDQRLELIEQLKSEDLKKFAALHKAQKIDADFYSIMQQEIDLYYKLLLSTDLFFTCRPKVYGFENEENKVDDSFVQAWHDLYNTMDSDWLSSPFFPMLMHRYESLHRIDQEKMNRDDPYALQYIRTFQKHLQGDLLEYAWGHMIYEGINNHENEKVWLSNWDEYTTTFPHSPLRMSLEPYLQSVADYHATIEQGSDEVVFIQEREQIHTFDDLFQHPLLQGQLLYIDLWATWCGPCKAELQYSIQLHAELDSLGITPVYISLDNDKADSKWQEMAQGFPLKGINIRVNKQLHAYINDTLPNFVGIPRYLIVSPNGEVVEWDALRPSDGKLLIDQLVGFKK